VVPGHISHMPPEHIAGQSVPGETISPPKSSIQPGKGLASRRSIKREEESAVFWRLAEASSNHLDVIAGLHVVFAFLLIMLRTAFEEILHFPLRGEELDEGRPSEQIPNESEGGSALFLSLRFLTLFGPQTFQLIGDVFFFRVDPKLLHRPISFLAVFHTQAHIGAAQVPDFVGNIRRVLSAEDDAAKIRSTQASNRFGLFSAVGVLEILPAFVVDEYAENPLFLPFQEKFVDQNVFSIVDSKGHPLLDIPCILSPAGEIQSGDFEENDAGFGKLEGFRSRSTAVAKDQLT